MSIKHTQNHNVLRVLGALASLGLLTACGMAAAERDADATMKAEFRLVQVAEPVAFRTSEGDEHQTMEMVKIKLVSRSPIPARALDPVIVVGEYLVTEYTYTAANELEFTAYQPEKMIDGAEVYFQWGTRAIPQQREKLPLIYDRKTIEVVTAGPGPDGS